MESKFYLLSLVLGIAPITLAQVVSWCKDQECGDCPSSVIAGPSEHPECVIYDTETVFGNAGFEEGSSPTIKYEVFADLLSVPCDGQPGGILIRSPSSFKLPGCGNAIVARPADSGCLGQPVQLQKTFLVQYCCGVEGCAEADLPIGSSSLSVLNNRGIGGRKTRSGPVASSFKTAGASSAGGSLFLTYSNGTIIPPKAVGRPLLPSSSSSSSPPPKELAHRQECDGWQSGSYSPVGDEDYYFKTMDTMIISGTVGPFKEDTEIQASYDQTIEVSTTFELSVGDPLGIISAKLGVTFARSETKGLAYTFTVPAGVVGRIGFTPVFVCSTGTLTDCDGNLSDETETCAPYKSTGLAVQGDYTLVL